MMLWAGVGGRRGERVSIHPHSGVGRVLPANQLSPATIYRVWYAISQITTDLEQAYPATK